MGPGRATSGRARKHRGWQLLGEERNSDRQPYPGTIETCLGRTWEIGVKDTTIAGTCEHRSVQGETDSVWTWNLTKVDKPGG